MKINFKSVMLGCCVGIMLSASVTAFASDATKSIKATFKNIKIYVDGAQLTPRDSYGNVLEPFIYNGTTYLPVRAVGEAVGKEVSYDANTNSVYIGNRLNTESGYVSGTKLEPYSKVSVSVKDITMSGNKYSNGICFGTGWNGNLLEGAASFNLGESYSTISGVYGTVDKEHSSGDGEATISFYGDGILLKSFKVTTGQIVKNFSINVSGVQQLDIKTEGINDFWGSVGIGNMYAS